MSNILIPVTPELSEGIKWFAIQQWVRQSCDNAGIGYSLGGYLNDIDPTDSEGVKWSKLSAWISLLAQNIGTVAFSNIVFASSSGVLGANTFTVVTAAGNTTQTLPSNPTKGNVCVVKNQGTGVVTTAAETPIIFTNALVSSFNPGGTGTTGNAATCTFDGTYWNVS